ncbi:MAG: sigma-54-dependent Fis family transcriptional regulator [Sedimentisphaerales bacterium]|nr:sigma-54-dependent Fis family transcriptional regulator [Sedimentisphaerales bacterium]
MIPIASDQVHHDVLIIDRDSTCVRILLEAFAQRAIRGTVAPQVDVAVKYLHEKKFDVVFLNLQTVSENGLRDYRLLRNIRVEQPETPILVTSDKDCARSAVETLRAGATEFYAKPLDKDLISNILQTLLPGHCIQTAAILPRHDGGIQQIVGSSPQLQETVERACKVAPTSVPVLIHGESGTGKELIAQLIHTQSRRANGPFIKLNCAALSESLLESELFGHEKGAFTGAIGRFQGRFERAHGGTLMLDEITETPLSFQAKLLRVLEEMNFQRVGGSEDININVRIISTTNTNILEFVRQGFFRADLYYRLATIRLPVPPLRNRPQDIPQLIWHFVNRFAQEIRRPITAVDEQMLRTCHNYSWPGNIRQLRNTIRAAMIFGSGQVLSLDETPWLLDELTINEPSPETSDLAGVPLKDIERQAILATLETTEGNQAKAAKVLGISGRTLREKIKKYRQSLPDFDSRRTAAAYS